MCLPASKVTIIKGVLFVTSVTSDHHYINPIRTIIDSDLVVVVAVVVVVEVVVVAAAAAAETVVVFLRRQCLTGKYLHRALVIGFI